MGGVGGWVNNKKKHTDLVELHEEELGVFLVQQRLGRLAVGAVGLGEDDDAVVVDDLLGLGLGGGHGGGRGRGQGAEEAAEDGCYGCGWVFVILKELRVRLVQVGCIVLRI